MKKDVVGEVWGADRDLEIAYLIGGISEMTHLG